MRILAWIVPLLAVAILVAGGWATSQKSFCVSCHTEQGDRLAESAHSSVTCYSCHLASAWDFVDQKGTEVFRMYPRAVGGVVLDGPGVRVSQRGCTRCHGVGPPEVLESKGLRIRHDACAPVPTPCDECHGNVAHGKSVRWQRAVVMDECLACHQQTAASAACDTCHMGRLERERVRSGPWQATHGPKWRVAHGMGDLQSCSACHEQSKCIACHGIEVPHNPDVYSTHGAMALKPNARCDRCHTNKSWCTACHGVNMPHPQGFLKAHSKEARGYQDSRCLNCHAPEDCVNCHEAHTHPGMTEGSLAGPGTLGGGRP